jgi:hypothetical protein
VILAARVDLLGVARRVNQRRQSANQIRAAAAEDFQPDGSVFPLLKALMDRAQAGEPTARPFLFPNQSGSLAAYLRSLFGVWQTGLPVQRNRIEVGIRCLLLDYEIPLLLT